MYKLFNSWRRQKLSGLIKCASAFNPLGKTHIKTFFLVVGGGGGPPEPPRKEKIKNVVKRNYQNLMNH